MQKVRVCRRTRTEMRISFCPALRAVLAVSSMNLSSSYRDLSIRFSSSKKSILYSRMKQRNY